MQIDESIALAIAGLAANHPDESVELFMKIFGQGEYPQGVNTAANRHPEFRKLAVSKIMSCREVTPPMTIFVREHSLPEEDRADFLVSHKEKLSFDSLMGLAWSQNGFDEVEIIRELQNRGLITKGDFETDYRPWGRLFGLQKPFSTCILSDSDEYPPRYDSEIRDLAAISQKGFPAERVRQRVIKPQNPHHSSLIEVSWHLDDQRFSFNTVCFYDQLDTAWLFRAVNESLAATGRSGRFFAEGDPSCADFVFGDPQAWIQAADDFLFHLYTEPEMPDMSHDRFEAKLLRSLES